MKTDWSPSYRLTKLYTQHNAHFPLRPVEDFFPFHVVSPFHELAVCVMNMWYIYPVRMGKVIGFVVVVVVVSTKIARSGILGEFASANCSYGVGNRKKTRIRASRLSKRDHESYKSCFLLVTPISHTHSNYLHMHTAHSRTRTLAIASAIFCTLAHAGYRSIFAGSMNDGNC